MDDMTAPEHHECARCGVADEDVIWSGNDAAYLHSAYVDCTSSDQCIAALKRENAELRAREERVAVGFKDFYRQRRPILGWRDDKEAFAAFKQSDAYPKMKGGSDEQSK